MTERIEKLATIVTRWSVALLATVFTAAMCAEANAELRGRGADLLKELDEAFVEIWEQVAPAVVNVDTEREITLPEIPPFLRQFFEDFGFRHEAPGRKRVPGRASGFVIDKQGHILTNYHVVKDADKIVVRFTKEEGYDGKVVGKDRRTDIALIKIDARKDLPTVALGDSDTLRVGQIVMAIGNPGGTFERTLTVGHVSGLGRQLPLPVEYQDFIQTDAAINLGNSGGPLVNANAEVVGINSARAQFLENIGFAVPINFAKDILPDLIEKGKAIRGYLGVTIKNLPVGAGKEYGLPDDKGAQVQDVRAGSPAEKRGLRTYDIITEVNGQKISSANELVRLITHLRPGTTVRITYVRDKKRQTVRLELAELPEEIVEEEAAVAQPEEIVGIEVRDITPDLAERLDLEEEKGVIITDVHEGSPAKREGVRPGDIIVEVNRKSVKNVVEFRNTVKKIKPGELIVLLLTRDKQKLIVHIQKQQPSG